MDITSSRGCVLKTFALEPVVLALSQNHHCKSEFITNLNHTLSTVRKHLSFDKRFLLCVGIEHTALEIVLLSVISCPSFPTFTTIVR